MTLHVYAGISYGFHVDTFALAVAAHAWPIFHPAARALDVITQRYPIIVEGSPRAHIGSLPLEVVERVRQALWWGSCELARGAHFTLDKSMRRHCDCREMWLDQSPPLPCWRSFQWTDSYECDFSDFCYGVGTIITAFCAKDEIIRNFLSAHGLYLGSSAAVEPTAEGMWADLRNRFIPARIVAGTASEQHAKVLEKYYENPSPPPQPLLFDESCFEADDATTDRLHRFMRLYDLPLDAPPCSSVGPSTGAGFSPDGGTGRRRARPPRATGFDRDKMPQHIMWQYTCEAD